MAKHYISSRHTDDPFLSLSGNQVLLLDCPQTVWVIQEGMADVYAVAMDGGRPRGRLSHLFRTEMGQTLFGLEPKEGEGHSTMGLMVMGIPGTTLIRRNRRELMARARQEKNKLLAEPTAYLVETWVMSLSKGILSRVPPNRFTPLQAGQVLDMKEGEACRPLEDIIWVRHDKGASRVAGREEMNLWPAEQFYPLTDPMWLESIEEGRVQAVSTLDLLDPTVDDKDIELWKALDSFHGHALHCIHRNILYAKEKEAHGLKEGMAHDQAYLHRAFQHLEQAVKRDESLAAKHADPLLEACRRVGLAMNIEIKEPPQWVQDKEQDIPDSIQHIALASGIRYRRVSLQNVWWKEESGPLLVFRREDLAPLAVFPGGRSPSFYDPVEGKEEKLTEEKAREITPTAYMLYRSFSDDPLSLKQVARYAFGMILQKDLFLFLFLGLAGGFLGLIMPYLTGVLVDTIIPAAQERQFFFFAQFLLVSTLSVFFFQVARSVAFLRVTTTLSSSIQGAIWDRLLKLPLAFFHKYPAGELGNRALSFDFALKLLSGMVSSTLFNSLFSLVNFLLIFYYSPSLAGIALLLTLIVLLISVALALMQYRVQREMYQVEGDISSLLLEMFGGISRFRTAGAENRAYYLWARKFGEQKRLSFRARSLANVLKTLSVTFPLLASTVIFFSLFAVHGGVGESISTGAFLAFNAAFTGMLVSLMDFSSQTVQISGALPLFERVLPILQTRPEVDVQKNNPGELRGNIEVQGLSFRYQSQDSMLLKNISLQAAAGEMIAIVGSSGSGKSTLFKLLLGFLAPEKGTIYFDGQDSWALDFRYIRQQMGVVLQDDHLFNGSILDNILGASGLTMEEAWEAARMAGIEEEIRAMPMGMHTLVSEKASNISGGQKQRLLIARAIVHKPRIILFDEATSALDNRTQAVVKESLDTLKCTRIVIAHRLSSVINADRIYVLDKGHIIQEGTYEELMAEKGFFKEMAQRQTLD